LSNEWNWSAISGEYLSLTANKLSTSHRG
jgi:hypothetical protein